MLTDIFARRYESRTIWNSYGEAEQRLLVQGFQLLEQDLFPMGRDSDANQRTRLIWDRINTKLARELGRPSLSATHYPRQVNYGNGPITVMEAYWENYIAKNYMYGEVDSRRVDSEMKERLSLIEIGFREMDGIVQSLRAPTRNSIPSTSGRRSSLVDQINARATETNRQRIATYESAIIELNTRFQQASAPLTYNSGYIQLSVDPLIEANIEQPFWNLMSEPRWRNVDLEMHEALDRRDSGRHDGGLYAAQALESAIKVISNDKEWTRGNEAGAAQYVDNLISQANGRFLEPWRGEALKEFFRAVRNPLGHGAGSAAPIRPTLVETQWAISVSMSWVRYLIERFNEMQAR